MDDDMNKHLHYLDYQFSLFIETKYYFFLLLKLK